MVAGLAVAAGILVARIPGDPAVRTDVRSPGALPSSWRSASGGIALYLGAAAARVGCALLGYAVMAGASGASDYSSLRSVRDGVVSVAVLSGAATLAMLAGVWRISRAPAESGSSGPALAALGFMVMGFVLDLVSTGITADALGGSVSAAFFAMDALPVLGCLSAALGVGAAVSLLRSFGNMATALGSEEIAARARATALLSGTTGAITCGALLALTHLTTELLLFLAVLLLPLAVATLVQFLRVALPLGREIRTRAAA
jgi:uncharacterized membrane protein YccF (DUF307 family)